MAKDLDKKQEKEIIDLFNTVEFTYLFPLMDYIYLLSVDYPNLFKQPPVAIYKKLTTVPILSSNQTYYREKDYSEFTIGEIVNLDILKSIGLQPEENIVDRNNNLILSFKQINEADKYLTTEPFINPYILDYIKEMIDDFISNNVKYFQDLHPKDTDKYLTDLGLEFNENGKLAEIFEDLFETIFVIVNEYPWGTYYTEIYQSDLVIKRSVDYRILDWMLKHKGD